MAEAGIEAADITDTMNEDDVDDESPDSPTFGDGFNTDTSAMTDAKAEGDMTEVKKIRENFGKRLKRFVEAVYKKEGLNVPDMSSVPDDISEIADDIKSESADPGIKAVKEVTEASKKAILDSDVIKKLTDGEASTVEELEASEKAQENMDNNTKNPLLKRVLLGLLAGGAIAGGVVAAVEAIMHHKTGCYQFQVQQGVQNKVHVDEAHCNCSSSSCAVITSNGYCPCQESKGCSAPNGVSCNYPYTYQWRNVSFWEALMDIPTAAASAAKSLVNKGLDFGLGEIGKILKKFLGVFVYVIGAILVLAVVIWLVRSAMSKSSSTTSTTSTSHGSS